MISPGLFRGVCWGLALSALFWLAVAAGVRLLLELLS